jgi:hypothetical protein
MTTAVAIKRFTAAEWTEWPIKVKNETWLLRERWRSCLRAKETAVFLIDSPVNKPRSIKSAPPTLHPFQVMQVKIRTD